MAEPRHITSEIVNAARVEYEGLAAKIGSQAANAGAQDFNNPGGGGQVALEGYRLRVNAARARYEDLRAELSGQQADEQLTVSNRLAKTNTELARGQFWIAVAIGVATFVQAVTTVVQLVHGWNGGH